MDKEFVIFTEPERRRGGYLVVGEQQAVGVFMFAGDFVVWQQAGQLLHEVDHLLMPGHVGHGQTAGRTLATVCHSLRQVENTVRHGDHSFQLNLHWITFTCADSAF